MSRAGSRDRRALIPATVAILGCSFLLLHAAAMGSDDRVTLVPRLQNGQTVQYQCQARVERQVQTKSNVATMLSLRPLHLDLSEGVRLAVQEIRNVNGRPMMAAEAALSSADDAAAAGARQKAAKVNFTLGGNGEVTRADGLDDLDAEQRLAWQSWISQFAFGLTLPSAGVKPGEKWKTVEVEKTPTPVANLVWERETTYAQNDRCPVVPEEQCASFLTISTLKQKSNPKDTTPEDYRLRELKTSGTVSGTNQVVTYISLKTGLLARATEDVQQSMDVTIAKADGSNQVQYKIDVTSHSETVFVPGGSAPAP